MPLSLAQAHVVIAAAHDHAVANGGKIAVAVVDEGGLLVALGREDDPEAGIFWGRKQPNGMMTRWSRPWFDWRSEQGAT